MINENNFLMCIYIQIKPLAPLGTCTQMPESGEFPNSYLCASGFLHRYDSKLLIKERRDGYQINEYRTLIKPGGTRVSLDLLVSYKLYSPIFPQNTSLHSNNFKITPFIPLKKITFVYILKKVISWVWGRVGEVRLGDVHNHKYSLLIKSYLIKSIN